MSGHERQADFKPYLSVVVTTRNDDHGKDLLKRTKIFIRALFAQVARHAVPTELIIVEWNPPSDKPRLREVLTWENVPENCSVRIIEVPASIHQRYQHAAALPLYQMIAKNVGIRRAKGEFILSTNIDIIFSHELFELFAANKLQPGIIYRVNRYDIDPSIPVEASLDEQLNFCRHNLVRLNLSRCHTDMKSGESNTIVPEDIFINPGLLPWRHVNSNACGDFQLLSRADWFSLHGYAEFDTFSLHIDSLLQYAAIYSGLKEITLKEPFRIYHIEHGGGWTPQAQQSGELQQSIESRKLRAISDDEVTQFVRAMSQTEPPIQINNDSWGLLDDSLWETCLK